MSRNIDLISSQIDQSFDVETLCADFGKVLPQFSTELLRAVGIADKFADLYEIEALNIAQTSALGLWAAGVTPALEALTATLLRNNDRLTAALERRR